MTKGGSDDLTDPRRPVYNNRKGSRHRLTPQAKEILETWLAKHWLNPYPTEEEKLYLARNCLITVTQVSKGSLPAKPPLGDSFEFSDSQPGLCVVHLLHSSTGD